MTTTASATVTTSDNSSVPAEYTVVTTHTRKGRLVKEHIRKLDGTPMTEADYAIIAEHRYEQQVATTEPTDLTSAPAQMIRGMGLEFQLARELIAQGSESARFAPSKNQSRLRHLRAGYYQELAERGESDREVINNIARASVSRLPRCTGKVFFVETNANGGEVYDILYQSDEAPYGGIVKLSAKTSTMEDKAYRFSSKDWILPATNEFNKQVFTAEDEAEGRTYAQAIERRGMDVQSFRTALAHHMADSMLSRTDDTDLKVMERLTAERFIGVGGYFKNLPDGKVRYYPRQLDTDRVEIATDTIRSENGTVFYDALLLDKDGNLKQSYGVSFRIKFKDGKDKPVRIGAEGAPNNLAATIALDMGDH